MAENAEKTPEQAPEDGPAETPGPEEDSDTNKLARSISKTLAGMRYLDAVSGHEIYNYFGGRIIEHTTSQGDVLAIKVNSVTDRSEGAMMHYAATHNNIRAPRVRGIYDIITATSGTKTKRLARAMVSDRVPGVPLADVWQDMSAADQGVVKEQLRKQLTCMRACTEPFIGGVGRQKVRNVYDLLGDSYCGPFDGEEAFDEWCLGKIQGGSLVRAKWRWLLRSEREKRGGAAANSRFVLTHGDLTPRNILVQGNVVTGIIDWERSGFFPEYAEYAFAMVLCHSHEEWWIPVLKELLPACSKRRLEFTALVETGVVNS
jgi:hypothetical protein